MWTESLLNYTWNITNITNSSVLFPPKSCQILYFIFYMLCNSEKSSGCVRVVPCHTWLTVSGRVCRVVSFGCSLLQSLEWALCLNNHSRRGSLPSSAQAVKFTTFPSSFYLSVWFFWYIQHATPRFPPVTCSFSFNPKHGLLWQGTPLSNLLRRFFEVFSRLSLLY